jgi:3-polyprenyl-4-hydroxybenzoate decarboxylase
LWKSRFFRSSRLLVLVAEGVDVQNPAQVYWQAVNRVDPKRDVSIEAARIGIDATRIPPGGRVEADVETELRVKRRWHEYGFD